jgi:hypothetical protein
VLGSAEQDMARPDKVRRSPQGSYQMKTATVKLESLSPYSQSKHYTEDDVPKKPRELHDAYERRTWRHRMHATHDGFVEIPGLSFANGIKDAAKTLGKKVPGRGSKTYTQVFAAGVMCPGSIKLPIKVDDVRGEELFVPSDGIPGSGKRVAKVFPRIDGWSGVVTFMLFDDLITEDVFTEVLTVFGIQVGVGRFRPARRGFYGMFKPTGIDWCEEVDPGKFFGQLKAG